MKRARIFISCGQRENDVEYKVADQIKRDIIDTKLGYEENENWPYLAGFQSEPNEEVVNNAFKRIEDAEYFVFIDFAREDVKKNNKILGKRGSVFVQQELAIARYLKKEILTFKEDGVIDREGILKHIPYKPIPFSDRTKLPGKVVEEVEKKWQPNWRDELEIILDADDPNYITTGYDTDPGENTRRTRWYHLKVYNHHRNKVARNCMVYLENCTNEKTGKPAVIPPLPLLEFKWQYVNTLGIAIPPKEGVRTFDAVKINFDTPSIVKLAINRCIIDNYDMPKIFSLNGPATYKLDFVLYSDNFRPSYASFVLKIPNKTKKEEHNIIAPVLEFRPTLQSGANPEQQ